MILTHDELETGELVPTWTSVDEQSVITFREVHEKMKSEGWVFDYYRTPVSSDRPIEVSSLSHKGSEADNVLCSRTITWTRTSESCER
jgi:hypothetical protein